MFLTLKLDNLDNYYIIAGDLNAKHTDWKNPNNNARGTALKSWLDNNNIIYKTKLLCTKYPSYPNGNSFLDIVLADDRITFHDLDDELYLNNLPYDSDHDAARCTISLDEENGLELASENKKHKYNFKKTNWEKFNKALKNTLSKFPIIETCRYRK